MSNELTLNLNQRYSYANYLTWLDNKRRELINGWIKKMSPAASSLHQETSVVLVAQLYRDIKRNDRKCKIFHAPFDVRLPKDGETEDQKIYTVVQPDICIVCDLSKIDRKGCLGAPDMVVEIQSLSTAQYDLTEKYNLYESSGVREYWVVIPTEGVNVFVLQPNGKYDSGTRYNGGMVPIHIFDNMEVDLDEVLNFR